MVALPTHCDTIRTDQQEKVGGLSMALLDVVDVKQEMSALGKRLAEIRGSL